MKVFLLLLPLAFLGLSATVLLQTEQAPLPLADELPPPSVAAAPVKPEEHMLSTEEFRTLGAEVMRALPRRGGVENGAGLPLVFAADQLGTVAEAVRNEPALASEAVTLYQECARSEQHLDSVRALCFVYLRALVKSAGLEMPKPSISREIKELANKIAG